MAKQSNTHSSLIDTARQAMAKAYAPYSNFHVGAAILDDQGQIHGGCNVENSSYPLGVCAEGSAISNMILSGGTQIDKILIVSSGEKMVTPCGGCRQKIREFATAKTRILIHHKDQLTEFSVADLLPHSFSKEHFVK